MPRFEPHPARRTTVVAGASSGIGAATATELAGRGFPVALGARRMDKLAELVDKIRADGGEAVAFPLDVTDPESVKSFVAQTVEALGEVELLVSSAGDMLPGQLHEVSTEAFAEQVQIHLVGANRLATAVLPAMVARRRGDLIFVGSDVGCANARIWVPTAPPRPVWPLWSPTCRWSWKAPVFAHRSCIRDPR